MIYKTEKELLDVLERFESGTIARGSWGHPEHLIVAYFYARRYCREQAVSKMRSGILELLAKLGENENDASPYHETLTVFWMDTVCDFVEESPDGTPVGDCSQLIERYGKDFPLRSYSHETLFSDRAKREYVEPDLASSRSECV